MVNYSAVLYVKRGTYGKLGGVIISPPEELDSLLVFGLQIEIDRHFCHADGQNCMLNCQVSIKAVQGHLCDRSWS